MFQELEGSSRRFSGKFHGISDDLMKVYGLSGSFKSVSEGLGAL